MTRYVIVFDQKLVGQLSYLIMKTLILILVFAYHQNEIFLFVLGPNNTAAQNW